MRTNAAVTPMPHLTVTFLIMSALYLSLGAIVLWLFAGHVIVIPTPEELESTSIQGSANAA